MMARFKITGEYITDMGRSLWTEDRHHQKAFAYMHGTFPEMNESQILKILTGQKKLIGDSSKGMELVDDDTKLSKEDGPLSLEHHFKELNDLIDRLKDESELDKCITTVVPAPQDIGGMAVIPLRRGYDFYTRKVPLEDMPHYGINQIEYRAVLKERCKRGFPEIEMDTNLLEMSNQITISVGKQLTRRRNIPTDPLSEAVLNDLDGPVSKQVLNDLENMDQIREEIFRTDRRPPPAPVYKITTSDGWLNPEGKFYVCGRLGHINLAYDLGFEEHALEKQGWVKISVDRIYGESATQKQMDLIFDRCTELGVKLPEWLTEKLGV